MHFFFPFVLILLYSSTFLFDSIYFSPIFIYHNDEQCIHAFFLIFCRTSYFYRPSMSSLYFSALYFRFSVYFSPSIPLFALFYSFSLSFLCFPSLIFFHFRLYSYFSFSLLVFFSYIPLYRVLYTLYLPILLFFVFFLYIPCIFLLFSPSKLYIPCCFCVFPYSFFPFLLLATS